MVDEDLNEMRRRYGKFSNPESAEPTSVLYGEFNELDENGEVKEGGNKTTTTLAIDMIRDDDEKNKFVGVKKDEAVVFNPMKAMKNEAEVSAMLKTEKTSEAMNSDYKYTVKTVNKIEKAELNQEFFDKAFGADVVHSEDELRSKIREGIASYFEKESDKKLQKDIRRELIENNKINLPDDFLKRMLKTRQEKAMDDHTFEHEYFHLAEDLKWDLIQGKLAGDQNIEVTQEEILNTARVLISQQFAQYGVAPPENEKLDELVQNYLQKDNNDERLGRTILSQKVFDFLKKNLKLDMIELPYEDYISKLKEQTQHELEHHQH
jgi:trigger factor